MKTSRHTTNILFIFTGIVCALSLFFVNTFNVSAASPIFYDSSFTFYVPDFSDSESNDRSDFTYRSLTLTQPNFGQTAQIYHNLGGILGNNSVTAFSTLNQYRIAIKSRDLFANGGTIYIAYLFAYGSEIYGTNSNLETNLNYSSFTGNQVSLSAPGSLSVANTTLAGRYITVSHTLVDLHNSSILTTEQYQNPANAIIYGFNAFDGSNFPHGVGMLKRGSTSQLLEAYSISSSKFWNYGLADNVWWRSSMHQIKLTIQPMPQEYWDYAIILLAGGPQAGSNIYGSRSFQTTVTIGEETENIEMAYCPIVYMCPIYNFVVSSAFYEPMAEMLSQINTNLETALTDLGLLASQPSTAQVAWLNEYQRKSQDAVAQASSMAAAAHYDFSKPNINTGDLSQYITGEQVRPLTGLIQTILSHSKLLLILSIAITASIIGYIFFGKRG